MEDGGWRMANSAGSFSYTIHHHLSSIIYPRNQLLLLHDFHLAGGGIVINARAVGRFGNFSEESFRHEFVQILGQTAAIRLKQLNRLRDRCDVNCLHRVLLRFADSAEVIDRRGQRIAGGGIGRVGVAGTFFAATCETSGCGKNEQEGSFHAGKLKANLKKSKLTNARRRKVEQLALASCRREQCFAPLKCARPPRRTQNSASGLSQRDSRYPRQSSEFRVRC